MSAFLQAYNDSKQQDKMAFEDCGGKILATYDYDLMLLYRC